MTDAEYLEMIYNIIIPGNSSSLEKASLYKPYIDYINSEMPNHLYRYRPCSDLATDAFEKDQLWFSTAEMGMQVSYRVYAEVSVGVTMMCNSSASPMNECSIPAQEYPEFPQRSPPSISCCGYCRCFSPAADTGGIQSRCRARCGTPDGWASPTHGSSCS